MKKIKNLMIGGIVFSTTFALVALIKRKNDKVKEVVEKNEELERNYIDLSEQLSKVEKENQEIKQELEEEKVLTKEYIA